MKSKKSVGYGLLGLFLLVVIGAIKIPDYIKGQTPASTPACVAYLHLIDGAKEQWALENKKSRGSVVDVAGVNQYIKGGMALMCPNGGKYEYGKVDQKPTCTVPGHTI